MPLSLPDSEVPPPMMSPKMSNHSRYVRRMQQMQARHRQRLQVFEMSWLLTNAG